LFLGTCSMIAGVLWISPSTFIRGTFGLEMTVGPICFFKWLTWKPDAFSHHQGGEACMLDFQLAVVLWRDHRTWCGVWFVHADQMLPPHRVAFLYRPYHPLWV
jgi:hypothetical protein